MTLQTQRIQTLEQVHRVAAGEELVEFEVPERASAYDFIRRTLVQFEYAALGKADKGAVKAYLAKMTGLSRAQLTRLVRQYRESGHIRDRRGDGPARPSRGVTQRRTCACSSRWTPRRAAMRPGHPGGASPPVRALRRRTLRTLGGTANRERMAYPKFRALGLCVTTGVVEGACKSVIGNRLKRGGMHWSVDGANAIIALRCAITSNRFDDYWERQAAAS